MKNITKIIIKNILQAYTFCKLLKFLPTVTFVNNMYLINKYCPFSC